ncbi:hypothetical protein, partial [Bacillus altitudinis]|uniref:hypothetical protein n=1 Tax=Bacillus altitudinis TaxID=293387 RepID=UPI001C92D5BC
MEEKMGGMIKFSAKVRMYEMMMGMMDAMSGIYAVCMRKIGLIMEGLAGMGLMMGMCCVGCVRAIV